MRLGIRIKTNEGEAFGGFIQRLAKRNGHTLLSLFTYLLHPGKKELKQADVVRLDFFPKNILSVNAIEKYSGVTFDAVRQHSFWSLLNHFVKDDEISSTKIMRDMLRSNYAYCPRCIHEYEYRKLMWNVRAITYCPTHNLRLSEVCNHCLRTIQLVHLRDCLLCPYCNGQLGGAGIVNENSAVPDYESFVWRSMTRLQEKSTVIMSAQHIALKLIYMLANLSDSYDYRELKNMHNKFASLEGLLQQARGSSRRRIHLLQILDAVYMRGWAMDDFLELVVPNSFTSQIIDIHKPVVAAKPPVVKRKVNQPSRKYNLNIPNDVEQLCKELYLSGNKITVREVARKINISENTLRKWKITEVIEGYKDMAVQRDYEELKRDWENGINQFLHEGAGDIFTGEIYDYLGVRPSLIRKVAPEMLTRIQELRAEIRETQRKFHV